MANKNYESGRNFEYRVSRFFKRKGYYVVRAFASKGIFDLVATSPKHSGVLRTFLVQAKYSRKNKIKITVQEKSRLAAATRRYKATSIIAYNEGRKLKFKLCNPYLLLDECTCSGKMGKEQYLDRFLCKECGVELCQKKKTL